MFIFRVNKIQFLKTSSAMKLSSNIKTTRTITSKSIYGIRINNANGDPIDLKEFEGKKN